MFRYSMFVMTFLCTQIVWQTAIAPHAIAAIPTHYTFNDDSGLKERVNLLSFKRVNVAMPKPAEPYDREKHFGDWISQKSDETCLDTRGKVLKRDSLSKVSMGSGCNVRSGEWVDPYTNRILKTAREIQIDHVVALSNAYRTGGYEWPQNKRCLYANFLGNKFHLLPVDGEENQKKLDFDPSKYMPPNAEFTCQYLVNWLKIKKIWNLRMTAREGASILDLAKKQGCAAADFEVSKAEIAAQQAYIQNNLNYCQQ